MPYDDLTGQYTDEWADDSSGSQSSTDGGAKPGGGGFPISGFLKYLLPFLGGALQGRNEQANLEQQLAFQREQLAQNKQLTQTNQAIDQSKLDPFRGVMAQTRNAGQLEHAMTPPPSYGPAAGSRYASAGTQRPPITLSPGYLLGLRNAQQGVLRGTSTMPNMMDPTNWGKPGTKDLTSTNPVSPDSPTPTGPVSPASLLAGYQRFPLSWSSRPAPDNGWI